MHTKQYVFPCSKRESLPLIVFKISGKEYPLSGTEYVQKVRIAFTACVRLKFISLDTADSSRTDCLSKQYYTRRTRHDGLDSRTSVY